MCYTKEKTVVKHDDSNRRTHDNRQVTTKDNRDPNYQIGGN